MATNIPFTPLMLGHNRNQQNRVTSVNPSPGIEQTQYGYTRTVQPDELASTQITKLTDKSNPYIQGARARGQRFMASRGMQNSSLGGAASEQAAIDAALPIASQDASAYEKAGAQNYDNVVRQQVAADEAFANASAAAASGAAAAQAAGIERDWRERQLELERERMNRDYQDRADERQWRTNESNADRGFRRDESRQDREFQGQESDRRFRQTVGSGLIDNMISNPEYFRDPEGSAGAFEFWMSQLNRIFQPYKKGP